jgi:ribonucleoside-triphosphate reductase (thioredoxin)
MTSSSDLRVDFQVIKRDNSVVPFDENRIFLAVKACLESEPISCPADKVTQQAETVSNLVCSFLRGQEQRKLKVALIQDTVESQLMALGLYADAKKYVLYRAEKDKQRSHLEISPDVQAAFDANDQCFETDLQKFQALDKFARYDEVKQRRETWPETVNRVMQFFKKHMTEFQIDNPKYIHAITEDEWRSLQDNLLNLSASPSMRCVQMAGPSLERCHVGVYNCAFQFIQNTVDLAEELYILMQGTGAGFSVEYIYAVEHFPRIKRQKQAPVPLHVVSDDTEGWCEAYRLGLDAWFNGLDIDFDYSEIRKEGSRLKTKGGRASGAGPLKELLEFAKRRILSKQGQYLTSLDLHDINCMAHRIVKMGGVRRASGISLSDLNDDQMRDCKQGEFWSTNNQRNQANNSAVYNEKPDPVTFLQEWLALAKSGTGERGIFNRGALKKQLPKRRKSNRVFGTNPCGEIILRHKQFCNLSIAVVRAEDTYEEIVKKVELATIWGTLQSTMTKFNYIGKEWKDNCEEERLLGVDLLGFLDHPLFRNLETAKTTLAKLQARVLEVNEAWAMRLNINPSAATTCVKPAGDSSVFFNTPAGFKGHHGQYFVRRVRAGYSNPVAKMLRDYGVPCFHDYDSSGWVLEFPVQAPKNGVLLEQQTALSQLELWKVFKVHWTEHNPSVTIYVRPEEWLDVGKWVYDNWDIVGGLSFLPYDGGTYPLAPYEVITEADYNKRRDAFPKINWAFLTHYEKSDTTDLHQQFACTGDKCAL